MSDRGEVMAPASRRPGGRGAGAVTLIALLVACGDDTPRAHAPDLEPAVDRSAADFAHGITTELDGAAPFFGDAVLAELLGDQASARNGFERVLASSDASASSAARSALHLAQLESIAGRSRHALDLAIRAAALAPGDGAIAEGVAQLRADAVAASGDANIRGPRLGTPLAGVAQDIADAFAEAERALATVHKLRPRPVIEALSSSIRRKEDATESVVEKYHLVAKAGGVASVAGHFRAGSLYHDLALGLLFELPPELDPNVAAGLRRTLRGRALIYLRKAVAEYELALASPATSDTELWRLAAETDLRSARDVLGES